jgi:hypothetical protein
MTLSHNKVYDLPCSVKLFKDILVGHIRRLFQIPKRPFPLDPTITLQGILNEALPHVMQCVGSSLGTIDPSPSVIQVQPVVIFRCFFDNLMHIPQIPLIRPVIFLMSWTWTGYLSNSTNSSITTVVVGSPHLLIWRGQRQKTLLPNLPPNMATQYPPGYHEQSRVSLFLDADDELCRVPLPCNAGFLTHESAINELAPRKYI